MSDPTSPMPEGPTPAGDAVADPTRVLQLFQVQITQTGSLPPDHLRALHAIDPELARRMVEEALQVQRDMLQEWIKQREYARELGRDEAKQIHRLAAQDLNGEIDDRARGRDFQGRDSGSPPG